MTRRREGLRRTRRSVWYDAEPWQHADTRGAKLTQLPRYYESSEAQMFIEDVGLWIVPHRQERSEAHARIWLEPPDGDFEQALVEALRDRGYAQDLTDAVCDFVRDCAKTVLCFGEAVYEVVVLVDPETDKVGGFDLAYLPPEQLVREGTRWFQHIPPRLAAERDLPKRIYLPSDSLVRFRAPAHLRNTLPPALECLAAASNLMMPGFIRDAILGERTRTRLDSAASYRQRGQTIAAATRSVGWDCRGTVREFASEYYLIHRHLAFRRFTIRFRESIFATLNELVERVSKRFGVRTRLRTVGLQTVSDVDAAERELRNGPSSLDEVVRGVR
jgi:hypothetical protein